MPPTCPLRTQPLQLLYPSVSPALWPGCFCTFWWPNPRHYVCSLRHPFILSFTYSFIHSLVPGLSDLLCTCQLKGCDPWPPEFIGLNVLKDRWSQSCKCKPGQKVGTRSTPALGCVGPARSPHTGVLCCSFFFCHCILNIWHIRNYSWAS